MKIFKIQVENYRLLKNFSIDLEDELSLVIGKNNTGKTSILSVLDKFLNQSEKNKFYFDDFNIDFKKEVQNLIEGDNAIDENDYQNKGIKLKLFIQYTETCNLENVSRVMMDLDPENNYIVLGFEYLLVFEKYIEVRKDYREFAANEVVKQNENKDYKPKSLYDFLRKNHDKYFRSYRKSLEVNKNTQIVNDDNFIDLDKELISIKDIINFKYISARRDVANKEVDKTLSMQTSKIYEKTETSPDQNKAVEDFKDKLSETDDQLSDIYVDLFKTIIKKVGDFGGIKPNESEIEIISNLQHRELLKGNTTVVYKHDNDNKLPEHYNGLGYMNLICMIFEIEILIQEFKREKEKKPADINLLFIEEPEAHTHPQMQYVFIKNIKKLIKEGIQREDGEKRKLQYIITTHSSHIVADSDFNDIKYLKKETSNSVKARSLKDLEKEYIKNGQEKNFRFLKQYLTINRAELFFADKAIFIEGDTERILLPAMMKKIDKDNPDKPLLSQNISIVEVGNYANIFEKFINFTGTKSLVITDLDSIKKDFIRDANGNIKLTKTGKQRKADFTCLVSEGERTSNPALNFFFDEHVFSNLIALGFENKRFKKDNDWIVDKNGFLQIAFQTNENGYQARSFEDSFFSIDKNRNFIKANRSKFEGLKNVKYFYDLTATPFYLAENCIESKGTFAIDILLLSAENDFQDWDIPLYIKEGLLWLKQD
ncbi:MAG: ATP-dependent endonuclease [Prevotellaceae bacterium]|jgi:predicted ATP-dependent endonuclease of OLD family|nr:ATP-dependent endonuclease [Prevotellaceae bacterium]